jgi:D-glycero-alpha-D-manno-heptose-7-phosphate kinase
MIISRSPVRITLGGGGTDLSSYYSKYGGALIAAAIDKYTLVTAHTRFDNDIKLNYSKTEQVTNIDEIKHNIFREGLRLLNIKKGIELTSLSDMPSSSGLGTSGSFTVAVLNALHTYKKEFVSQKQLAEEACRIEIEILKEPIGKQDQYIAAFGGITSLQFAKNGAVTVEPVKMSEEAQDELHSNIMLFYTGISRSASNILREQDEKSKKEEITTIETLHKIKRIGLETKKAFEQGNVDKLEY